MRYLCFLGITLALLACPVSGQAQTTAPESTVITANPYLGMPISTYDARVSRFSPIGANNPYTTGGGRVYSKDGTYLGRLNSNRYDPESVSNPYGQYGSRSSSTSINNPYSNYGSRYSPQSATNPFATTPPVVRYAAPPVSTYKPPCYYNCD